VKFIVNKRVGGRRVVLVLVVRPDRSPPWRAIGASAAAASGVGYLLHRVGRRSGVTDAEAAAALPGDDIVPQPLWQSTRGITIGAPPEEVWPWIVQMGYPRFRAGWYTPYWLDRLQWGIREHSAEKIVDDLQSLSVGDRVPDSPDWSVFFTVAQVQPPHALVLHSNRHLLRPMQTIDFSWAFLLRPLTHNRARLLVRARARYSPRWSWLVLGAPYLIGDFLNTGNILRAVKARAEARPAPTST
jgi:hypothetical protein